MQEPDDQLRLDAVKKGMVAYVLEKQQGLDEHDAVEAAISGAIRSYTSAVVKHVVFEMLSIAESMDLDEDFYEDLLDDGVATVLWVAREFEETIPLDDRG